MKANNYLLFYVLESWWFVFDPKTLLLLFPPQQCSGKTSSPHTLVVFTTLEECEDYISTNNLQYQTQEQTETDTLET